MIFGASRSTSTTSPSRRNLHSHAVDELGQRIMRGEWKPGEVMPNEAALGTSLGISRSVVREAVKSLAAKGLVETRTRTGTRVRPADEWNLLDVDVLAWRYSVMPRDAFFRELFEVRRLIEPAAAHDAARRASATDVSRIAAELADMESADPRSLAAVAADQRFHLAILASSGNPLLLHIGRLIAAGLETSHRISTDSYAASLPLHRPVYDAIRTRDPAGARTAMMALLERASTFIEDVMGSFVAKPAAPSKQRKNRATKRRR